MVELLVLQVLQVRQAPKARMGKGHSQLAPLETLGGRRRVVVMEKLVAQVKAAGAVVE